MQPMVTFISDDGTMEDWTVLRPVFESAGVPCAIAVTSGLIGSPGYMDLDRILHLQNELGWEVASHLDEHVPLTELSEEEMDRQCKISKEKLREMGLRAQSVVYPYGANDAAARRIARTHYRAGFQATGGINTKRTNRFRLNRVALGAYFDARIPVDTGSFAYYKARIDEAIYFRSWLVFMLHPAANAHDESQQRLLIDTLAYIGSRDVPVVTIEQGLQRLGQEREPVVERDTFVDRIRQRLFHRIRFVCFLFLERLRLN